MLMALFALATARIMKFKFIFVCFEKTQTYTTPHQSFIVYVSNIICGHIILHKCVCKHCDIAWLYGSAQNPNGYGLPRQCKHKLFRVSRMRFSSLHKCTCQDLNHILKHMFARCLFIGAPWTGRLGNFSLTSSCLK